MCPPIIYMITFKWMGHCAIRNGNAIRVHNAFISKTRITLSKQQTGGLYLPFRKKDEALKSLQMLRYYTSISHVMQTLAVNKTNVNNVPKWRTQNGVIPTSREWERERKRITKRCADSPCFSGKMDSCGSDIQSGRSLNSSGLCSYSTRV